MKKMKKLMALLMTVAMVMGMAMTTMAADVGTANITVKNLEKESTIKAVHVIKPSTITETGWKFADTDMKGAFQKVYPSLDDQEIIWKLIKLTNPEDKNISSYVIAATAEEVNKAIGNIDASKYSINGVNGNVVTVSDAGVYAIKATAKQGSDTVYAPMAGYVSFGYNENGVPSSLTGTTVYAKKSRIPMEKDVEDDDDLTEIGKTVTYTVKTAVPYAVNEWKLKDRITGASYVQGNSEGTVTVSVKVGSNTSVNREATISEDGTEFELDLSEFVRESNLGAEVTLSYKAIVNDTIVSNTITYGTHTSEEVKLYTADIEMTKYAEDADNKNLEDNVKLPGAGFIVYKETVEGETTIKEYAKFGDNNKLNGWTTTESEATEVFTNDQGKVTVHGLDKGTYYFQEKTAPEGYSVNQTPVQVTITQNDKATDIVHAYTHMLDTKLSSLPSTGGIGTTIFTIGGCVIMIVAAGLFFASRRKENQ